VIRGHLGTAIQPEFCGGSCPLVRQENSHSASRTVDGVFFLFLGGHRGGGVFLGGGFFSSPRSPPLWPLIAGRPANPFESSARKWARNFPKGDDHGRVGADRTPSIVQGPETLPLLLQEIKGLAAEFRVGEHHNALVTLTCSPCCMGALHWGWPQSCHGPHQTAESRFHGRYRPNCHSACAGLGEGRLIIKTRGLIICAAPPVQSSGSARCSKSHLAWCGAPVSLGLEPGDFLLTALEPVVWLNHQGMGPRRIDAIKGLPTTASGDHAAGARSS